MSSENSDKTEKTRKWRNEDRAKTSIFQIFRDSHYENDAFRRRQRAEDDGSVEVTRAHRQRREGVSAKQLRQHIEADLTTLISTTRLGSAIDLEDAPHVAGSVLNYGFQDFSNVGPGEFFTPEIAESIRKTLLTHEPRLIGESLEVIIDKEDNNDNFRLRVEVKAELMGDPVDIPLEFDAEVDLGAGKLSLFKLQVRA